MREPPDRLKSDLADRYEIERELGIGGMAVVYLALDLGIERRVAIKEGGEEGSLDVPPMRGACQVITVTAQSELESRW